MTRMITMASTANYRICIQGCFPVSWADWFEDTTVQVEPGQQEDPRTTLTCRVKDQAALLGILMKLNGLNAPIISISLIDPKDPGRQAEEKGETP